MAEAEAEAVAEAVAEAEAVADAAQCSEQGKPCLYLFLLQLLELPLCSFFLLPASSSCLCRSCLLPLTSSSCLASPSAASSSCLGLFLLQLLELPLPLQLLTVPMLSSQPFSWGLRFQEPRPGGSHWRVWSSFRFSPSKPL